MLNFLIYKGILRSLRKERLARLLDLRIIIQQCILGAWQGQFLGSDPCVSFLFLSPPSLGCGSVGSQLCHVSAVVQGVLYFLALVPRLHKSSDDNMPTSEVCCIKPLEQCLAHSNPWNAGQHHFLFSPHSPYSQG